LPSRNTKRWRPAEGVISTQRERTGICTEGKLPCPMPGCSKVFNTPGWLARHLKSNHSGIAVTEHSITLLTIQVAVVKPALLPVLRVQTRLRAYSGEQGVSILKVVAGQLHSPVTNDPKQLIVTKSAGVKGITLGGSRGERGWGGQRLRCQLHRVESPPLLFQAVTFAVQRYVP